jgi:hypothetical protein
LARYYRGWHDLYSLDEDSDKQYWTDGTLIQSEWDIEKLVELAMSFPH